MMKSSEQIQLALSKCKRNSTAKKSAYCTRFETYNGGGDFMTDTNTHVTHWMNLPEALKEEA